MRSIFILSIIGVIVCAGCATPDRLSRKDMRSISSLSIAVSTTITQDVSGFTDSVDLPNSKIMGGKVLDIAKTILQEKQYQVADQHLSVGNAYSNKKHYVVADNNDRGRDLSELQKRRGPYYSNRLSAQQLALLFEDLQDHDDIPSLGSMGFQGDATLLLQVQGRLIGSGKLGAALANVAIMTLYIAGGGGSFGGAPDLKDTADTYKVQMRLYTTENGRILWQSDIKEALGVEEVLRRIASILKERIS